MCGVNVILCGVNYVWRHIFMTSCICDNLDNKGPSVGTIMMMQHYYTPRYIKNRTNSGILHRIPADLERKFDNSMLVEIKYRRGLQKHPEGA